MNKQCNTHLILHLEGVIAKPKSPHRMFMRLGQSGERFDMAHLYITSSDVIKEGDWVLCDVNKGVPRQVYLSNNTLCYGMAGNNLIVDEETSHKIIASTDTTLNLPLLPESFIKKYVEENGEINEVLVEFELYKKAYEGDVKLLKALPTPITSVRPKTREDNTIRILPAKTYTREEVTQALHDFADFIIPNTEQDHIKYDKWIEDNLK